MNKVEVALQILNVIPLARDDKQASLLEEAIKVLQDKLKE